MSKEILNFKALSGQVGVDEALGIVECFVAVIGNKDSVGDVIIPGAFDKSLRRRKPRVVWGHDWNQPIGKVLDIFEVPPSDSRLPMKVKSLGLGAVYARVQFNLKSERGREAFSSIMFFGEEQEWSIGYKTLDAVFDPKMQANILKELELYEVSPVLHGANQLTSTLSIKDAKESKGSDGPCWPGYVQIGMKKGKNGEMVPNCVPADGKSSEEMMEEMKVGNSPGNSRIENLASLVPGADSSPGKRGGDLSDLLRYWRKIMVQEGGFRRCRVILADHPELYPLNNICAWLHHETTGLWPNEGCHHPGMKNCRRKLKKAGKKPSGPSLWTEAEFANRIERNIPGKSLDMEDFNEDASWDDRIESGYEMAKMWSQDQNDSEDEGDDFDETDYKSFAEMLKGYFAVNPDIAEEVMNDANWTHEGEDMNGDWSEHAWLVHGVRDPHDDCGCGGMKSDGGTKTKNLTVIAEIGENPLATALKTVLSDTFAMYLKAHGYHWNVQGQDFSQYHLLFAEIYVDVFDAVDPLAESIRKLRVFAPYKLSELAAMSGVEETVVTSDPQSMARDLKDTNDRVISILKSTFKIADSMDEQGIADLIAGRIDAHEKWRWQLESSIDTPAMVKDAQGPVLFKAGRVLSGKNMAKLQMAYEALGEVINGGTPQQGVQVKVDTDCDVEVTANDPAAFVRHISPVAEYHGFPISVDRDGTVSVKSVLNEEAVDALTTAIFAYSGWNDSEGYEVKGIGRGIGGAIGRARGVFDPNARDAEGDGLVQEGTAFERPATVKGPKKLVQKLRESRLPENERLKVEALREAKPAEAVADILKNASLDDVLDMSDWDFWEDSDANFTLPNQIWDGDSELYNETDAPMANMEEVLSPGDVVFNDSGMAGIVIESDNGSITMDDWERPYSTVWQTHENGKLLPPEKQKKVYIDMGDLVSYDKESNELTPLMNVVEGNKSSRESAKKTRVSFRQTAKPTTEKARSKEQKEREKIRESEAKAKAKADAKAEKAKQAAFKKKLKETLGSDEPMSPEDIQSVARSMFVSDLGIHMARPSKGTKYPFLPHDVDRYGGGANSRVAALFQKREVDYDIYGALAAYASTLGEESRRKSTISSLKAQRDQVEEAMKAAGLKPKKMSLKEAEEVLLGVMGEAITDYTKKRSYKNGATVKPSDFLSAAYVVADDMVNELSSYHESRTKKSLPMSALDQIMPVINYHGIPYEVKGGNFVIDTMRGSRNAREAIKTAIASIEDQS